jgi:hypothetical protein
MKVIISVELCEKRAYAGRREILFKNAEWDAIPPEGAWMSYGKSEEEGRVSATKCRVNWNTMGTVSIMLQSENLLDEFDDILRLAKNEGFLPFSEWEALNA